VIFFLFCFVLLLFFARVLCGAKKSEKCERRAEGKARGLGGDPGCAVGFYALV